MNDAAVKMFVADHSPEIRERILQTVAAFPQLGFVGTASPVPGCIDGVQATKPDLLILDLRIPGGSGFDVLRKFEHMEACLSRLCP